jgi:hypothetical protein
VTRDRGQDRTEATSTPAVHRAEGDDGQNHAHSAVSAPLRITPDQLRSAAPEVYQSYQALIQQNGGGEQNITINVEACPQSPSEGNAPAVGGALPSGTARRGMAYSDLVFYDLFEPEIGALYRKAWKRQVKRQLGLDRAAATTTPATRTSGGHAGVKSSTAQATRFGSEHRALPHRSQPTPSSTMYTRRRKRTNPWMTLLIGLLVILMGVGGSVLVVLALSY